MLPFSPCWSFYLFSVPLFFLVLPASHFVTPRFEQTFSSSFFKLSSNFVPICAFHCLSVTICPPSHSKHSLCVVSESMIRGMFGTATIVTTCFIILHYTFYSFLCILILHVIPWQIPDLFSASGICHGSRRIRGATRRLDLRTKPRRETLISERRNAKAKTVEKNVVFHMFLNVKKRREQPKTYGIIES